MIHYRLVAGIAAGALAVIAFNNRKEIASGVKKGYDKTKVGIQAGIGKTKQVITEVKDTTVATAECIKEKAASAKSTSEKKEVSEETK